ncbi:hypothetical protein TNCT_348371 [Trichonephila clavata]|uniref:Uncharacterized protein n=1 Tax=Trichonephila clavata TaxID=2740835 RepID=A0A8X6IYK7_TRICU|nr:hypothetical protein TNCT_348371 [Trichonephila clavata]
MKPEKDKVACGNECESSWRKAHMVSIRRCRGQPAERPSQIRPLLSQPCHLWIWLSSSSSSVVVNKRKLKKFVWEIRLRIAKTNTGMRF